VQHAALWPSWAVTNDLTPYHSITEKHPAAATGPPQNLPSIAANNATISTQMKSQPQMNNLTSMTFLWMHPLNNCYGNKNAAPFPRIASPPVNTFHQEQLEEHVFPVLYPRGRFGLGYDLSAPIYQSEVQLL
jgi:hypothetical protein